MKNKMLYSSDIINSEIKVNDITIGGKKKIIIAGPCTFGSFE